MINDGEDTITTHSLRSRISIFHYIWLLLIFFQTSLSSKRKLVIDLPCEVQYPYIYFDRESGYNFINFAENLKKLFHIKLYWTNCSLNGKIENSARLSVSWDYIPKNIHLLINSKLIRQGKNRVKKLLQPRKGVVSFI